VPSRRSSSRATMRADTSCTRVRPCCPRGGEAFAT